MNSRPKVGEILVSAGIIDEMQLEAALGEQARWGRRLGVTLIKMGMVEEGHLIRALAKQLDLPVASLVGKRIPDNVVALVPARVASENGVIPLFTRKIGSTSQLFLGMEDPSNLAVLDDLSFRTGMEIHPVMVGPSELGQAIDRYYHGNRGGPPLVDPFYKADTMGAGSLRVVTDDAAQPGTAPAPEPVALTPGIPEPIVVEPELPSNSPPPSTPDLPAARAASPAPEVSATGTVSTETAATGTSQEDEKAPSPQEIELLNPMAQVPDHVLEDVANARIETERTRVVAKAIAQLMIKKGLITLEELQNEISEVKSSTPSACDDGDRGEDTSD